MGQALYRKYRPRSLEDVAGQEHITRTLRQAIKSQQISHAYLFTGPKGVGKTSVARILAHEINGLTYNDDEPHIDIIEIDAASNRRIDEIRELRERVYIAPSIAKYKVYIIDEVHMLTREAFNALLKTLEEPPAHVVFILATTDSHKLPGTIISRTQRYSFKPISPEDMAKYLGKIVKNEKIVADTQALQIISEHGQGSMRDSVSILDQARSFSSKVTAESVTEMLGLPSKDALNSLINLTLKDSSSATLISNLSNLYEQGYQAGTIAKEISEELRVRLINSDDSLNKSDTLKLLRSLLEVNYSSDPNRLLEIVLLNAQPKSINSNEKTSLETTEIIENKTDEEPKIAEEKPITKKETKLVAFDETQWQAVLMSLKAKHNTLYGVVRMAEPTFAEDGTLDLAFAFDFHKKRLSESANSKKLSDIIKELTGQSIKIVCRLDKNAKPPTVNELKTKAEPEKSEDLSTISSIFNGAELLES